MRVLRIACTVVLLVALGVASARTTSAATSPVLAGPCTSDALGGPFSGPLPLKSIDDFGCEGAWAFAWATLGTGQHQVGVTEVLHFNFRTQRWQFATRASACQPGVMPEDVYRHGCFSN
jgi:hypothetical protein